MGRVASNDDSRHHNRKTDGSVRSTQTRAAAPALYAKTAPGAHEDNSERIVLRYMDMDMDMDMGARRSQRRASHTSMLSPGFAGTPSQPIRPSVISEHSFQELKEDEAIGFASSFESTDEHGCVFQNKFIASNGNLRPRAVLKYDSELVMLGGRKSCLSGPLEALFSRARDVTVFAVPQLMIKCCVCLAGTVTVALSAWFLGLDELSEEAISSLNATICSGVFFLLGPHASAAVVRWWDVRRDGIGGLWSAVDDLSSWAASWFAEPTPADNAARALVLRYGLCSHALLFKQARGEDNLSDLVQAGLLQPAEAAALAPLPSKAQVVWAWHTRFWTRVIKGELRCSKLHAPTLAPLVMDKCMKGRGSIARALAYIDTQPPFPYVHLLSFIVEFALVTNVLSAGAHVGLLLEERISGATFVTSGGGVTVIIVTTMLRVCAFPLIYGGLLAIAVALDNPCGSDTCDFPALAYQTFMKAECEAFHSGVDALKDEWWDESLTTPKAEGQAEEETSKGKDTMDQRLQRQSAERVQALRRQVVSR